MSLQPLMQRMMNSILKSIKKCIKTNQDNPFYEKYLKPLVLVERGVLSYNKYVTR